MPINIYLDGEDDTEKVAWLCDGNWRLPDQIEILEQWLKENHASLKRRRYVADIGFVMREEASGGGAVLSSESMRVMGEIGMSLYLSEYRE